MDKFNNIFKPFGTKKGRTNKPKQVEQASALAESAHWHQVKHWYLSDLGQALLESEKQQLDTLLERVFGYNLVQLGRLDSGGLLGVSRTSQQCLVESILTEGDDNNACIVGEFSQLALQNQSIDALILPHTLEFETQAHQILREVERVLVAEGKAIFLGFNPYSLWGMWHKYWEIKSHIAIDSDAYQAPLPSCGQLISQRRLRDWLSLLGFDVECVVEHFYRPPLSRSALLTRLDFMERVGRFSSVLPAGAYVLLATKRVSTLTPIRQRWKFPKPIISADSPEPARCILKYKNKGK